MHLCRYRRGNRGGRSGWRLRPPLRLSKDSQTIKHNVQQDSSFSQRMYTTLHLHTIIDKRVVKMSVFLGPSSQYYIWNFPLPSDACAVLLSTQTNCVVFGSIIYYFYFIIRSRTRVYTKVSSYVRTYVLCYKNIHICIGMKVWSTRTEREYT